MDRLEEKIAWIRIQAQKKPEKRLDSLEESLLSPQPKEKYREA